MGLVQVFVHRDIGRRAQCAHNRENLVLLHKAPRRLERLGW
jgi:hypothetical protein